MADSVFYGGDILTMEEDNEQVEAVSVKDGKILATGAVDDVMKTCNENTKKVDLGGKTLMPGFIAMHNCPLVDGLLNTRCTSIIGYGHRSRAGVFGSLKRAGMYAHEDHWIVMFGYDPALGPELTRLQLFELDEITTRAPVCIVNQTGDFVHCNSVALKEAGINLNGPPPVGIEFVKDNDGRHTCTLTGENAVGHVLGNHFKFDEKWFNQFKKDFFGYYARAGYTTVVATTGAKFKHGPQDLVDATLDLSQDTSVPVSVIPYRCSGDSFAPSTPTVEKTMSLKGITNVNGIVTYLDGEISAGKAAISAPYLENEKTDDLYFPDSPNYGNLNHKFEGLLDQCRTHHQVGKQIVFYAMGRRAIGQALETISSILDEHLVERPDHRYLLLGCGDISKEQLQKAKSLGVGICFALDYFHYYGQVMSEQLLGDERVKDWFPLKDATDDGIEWSLMHGMTSYETQMQPMTLINAANTRCPLSRDHKGNYSKERQPINLEQIVPAKEGLKAFTIHAAKQISMENEIGSIKVGKRADFVLLNKNPLKVDIKELMAYPCGCVATIRGGKQMMMPHHGSPIV